MKIKLTNTGTEPVYYSRQYNNSTPTTLRLNPADHPQLVPNLPIGVQIYLSPDPDRPDLFQHQETAYHFPCSACIHAQGPQDHCRNCRHYVL